MLEKGQKCKPYYVACVNLIMPSKCKMGAEKGPKWRIMRSIIQAIVWISAPGNGGTRAHPLSLSSAHFFSVFERKT